MNATLLEVASGPLTPGLYLAPSRTSGYDLLMAAVVAGQAQLVGERFLLDGRKAITVHVGGPKRNPDDGPRKITIGREFFVTALKDYHDWKQKWWREAVQNSVDGGASKVDLSAAKNADGTWTVRCSDNGRGMSEDVLLNKFLVLGGTTKVGQAGASGGFGKAKELLILPWISWKIHTKNVIAQGSGIDYSVTRGPTIAGTVVEVVMPEDNYTYGAPAEAFLAKCFLPQIHFTVDGGRGEADLGAEDAIQDLGIAKVFTTTKEGYTGNYVYVRVNGIFMFETFIGATPGTQVICEITAPSVQVLTANRDGFRDPALQHSMAQLINRIAKDTKSALRKKEGLFERVYEGDPALRFTSKQKEAEIIESIGPVSAEGPIVEAAIERVAQIVEGYRQQTEASGQGHGATGIVSGEIVQVLLRAVASDDMPRTGGQSTLEAAAKQFVWKPDFTVRNEIKGFKVPKKFMPEGMTPTITKLARVWGELCRWVLIQLACERPYGIGFLFDPETGAAYKADNRFGEGSGWLLLNPAKNFKKLRWGNDKEADVYSPSKPGDLKWLYAAAVHECTHMADGIDYHDEDFAAALTHNFAKCADGLKVAKKIVAGIKLREVEGVRQGQWNGSNRSGPSCLPARTP